MAVEETFVKWIVGGIVGAGAVIAGHIHARINRIEDRRETDREKQEDRRAKIWAAVDLTKDRIGALALDLKENYPTKSDLRDTEQRIIHAINGGK